MKASIITKLQTLTERYEEVQALLGEADIINDQNRFRALGQEYAQLADLVECFSRYNQAQDNLSGAEEMLKDEDPEMRDMAQDELKEAKKQIATLTEELQILLLPKDPRDDRNIYLEIRAGAGGDEAAIFAGDLFRMYSRYAEKKRWRVEVVNMSDGEHGGYKEIIAHIEGVGVYGLMKFESGGHRVQRVPETESQGRVHTSACTVAILPEIPPAEAVEIKSSDLRVDTYRSSGAGGQHVNKTESAIRLTHLPTGTVVECQEERSQHKNRAKAMAVLQSRIQAAQDTKRASEEASTRKSLVGSGDRSERIRTYNYPQSRISDHRINLTLYRLAEIVEGELELILTPLLAEHHAEQLASLADE